MISKGLPLGTVIARAYVESLQMLIVVLETENPRQRVFLRVDEENVELVPAWPQEMNCVEMMNIPGGPEVLFLLDGPTERRHEEPLIGRRRFLWRVNVQSRGQVEMVLPDGWIAEALLGPSVKPGVALCIASRTKRTAAAALMQYSVVEVDVLSAEVRLQVQSVGTRW